MFILLAILFSLLFALISLYSKTVSPINQALQGFINNDSASLTHNDKIYVSIGKEFPEDIFEFHYDANIKKWVFDDRIDIKSFETKE